MLVGGSREASPGSGCVHVARGGNTLVSWVPAGSRGKRDLLLHKFSFIRPLV